MTALFNFCFQVILFCEGICKSHLKLQALLLECLQQFNTFVSEFHFCVQNIAIDTV